MQEVDACLHEADRDKEIKVVILKANGKGFCGGHVARWGPDENPYPDFGDTFEDLYKGTADLFLWPTLYLWEFPKPTISQIHGYCMGGGIYLGLLTDFCVASEDAYFQMPLAQSLGEPGGHTMIEPWLLMNWHRTMDWLLLAPTLSAQEALEWGLLNKVVPRDQLEDTVEEMARKIGQIPLTTSMAVKNNVKRAYELMGMRVHLQVSHILTNMVGAATDVQERRRKLIESGLKPRDFIEDDEGPRATANRVMVVDRATVQSARGGSATRGVAGGDVAEDHRVGDAPARTQIVSAHHRGGDVAGRVQTLDHLVVLVEHLRVFVGDHSPARSDVGREDPGGVVRRAIDRPERGVRFVAGIAEAVVVGRLAAAEVGVEALGGELVEALDRLLQFIGGDIDLAGQVGDRFGALDGSLLDQCLGQAALLRTGWRPRRTGRRSPRRRPASTAPPCWRTSPCRPRRRSSTRCRTAYRSRRRRSRRVAVARIRATPRRDPDENHWQPPGLVQQVGPRAESHRRLQHLTGVAGVRDRPVRLIGLVSAVSAAHVRVVG